ncbi:MAG: NAD-binding protein [Pseudomonadaceae bacterium]|nr:NAD-binding protein [Pseudomonadaceae bacterium]
MQLNSPGSINWRWWAAAGLFSLGFIGLLSGTSLSERPDVVESSWLTKAYYALGLFVVGGLDIGTPQGGTWWSRSMLWVAYFGAPFLTASAVIDALIQAMSRDNWHLRRMQNHIIVFGSGALTLSYLRLLRRNGSKQSVIVVDKHFDPVREQELINKFGVTTIVGNLTHDYLLQQMRLHKARRVLLFGDDDFEAFEAATRILAMAPSLAGSLILHCHNLRFMRSLQDTELARSCHTFNTYNLAGSGFVDDYLVGHFHETKSRDVVVIAGFGRFGQSVLEGLQNVADGEIEHVCVIDIDADRRVLVAAEQEKIGEGYKRTVFEGDVSHPVVWEQLAQTVNLGEAEPTVILGTGREQDNLRTALWIKERYPNALVFARTNDISRFASSVGASRDIRNISITQLMEDHIPGHWLK